MDAKDTARRLRAAIQDVIGQDVTHSQALEITARLQGCRNWHELQRRDQQTAPPGVADPSDLGPSEFTGEEKEILAGLARRDPSPVYDFEDSSPDRVPTHHVEVPGVGVAHRDGGAGVYVTTPARDTTCSSCGAPIRVDELCTRSADKKGTTAGIRYTRCRTCVPIVVTARDPEAVRLERHVDLVTRLTFRTRENALVFFREIADTLPTRPAYFTPELDGDRLAQKFGLRLPDPPRSR